MAEPNERLAAIMAKQERKKQEAAPQAKQEAAEKARAESEARRGEMSKESEAVGAKIAETEAAASEAVAADEQFKAYAAEQGNDLDPEVKAELGAEIAACESRAAEANAKLAELRSEKARIDEALASLGATEGAVASESAAAEVPAEATAEVAAEAPIEVVAEQPAQAAEVAPEVAEKKGSMKIIGAEQLQKAFASFEDPKVPLSAYREITTRLNDGKSGDTGAVASLDDAGIAELQGMRLRLDGLIQKSDAGTKTYAKDTASRLDRMIETGKKYIELRDPEALQRELDDGGAGADKIRSINELLDMGEKAPALREAVLDKVGTGAIDTVTSARAEAQRNNAAILENPNLTKEHRIFFEKKKFDTFNAPGFKALGQIAREMERSKPEVADKYNKFILDAIAEKFVDAKPEEVRKSLYSQGDNEIAYVALNNVLARMAKGSEMPDDVQESLAKALRVFEASDSVDDKDNASRFLNDSFIEKKALGGVKREDKATALEKIRDGIAAVKKRFPGTTK